MTTSIAKNKKIILPVLLTLLICGIIICLIIEPQVYINSFFNGMLLWATAVLPALFPFVFLTKLLAELMIFPSFCSKFGKIFSKIFKAPAISGYIFLVSIVSGYPIGAKLTASFCESGQISSKTANKILTFCSTSGPLFIVGTVGISMFASRKLGYIMLASHIMGAIVNGLFYRNKFVEDERECEQTFKIEPNFLSKTMYDSIISVLTVGAFIAMFFVIIDIGTNTQILSPVKMIFEKFFNFLGFDSNLSQGFVEGIIEVTKGRKQMSNFTSNIAFCTSLACFVISFGGFSIHCQALTFLNKSKISVGFYLIQKLTHAIFSFLICYLLMIIL